MEQKTLSLVLKLVLIGFAAAGIIVYFWAIPVLGSDFAASYPEFAHCYWPWLIFLWITAIPCYVTLFFGWSIATEIGRDNSFSVKNAVSLRNIALLAAGDALFFFAGNVLYLFLNMNHPAIFLVSCFVVFLGVAVAVAAASLSHLVYKAAKIREENDLTI